ncbi:alpha/beta hydrolase family protein [Tautonia plasticadhaerens]|uniref:Acetyl xylan esterase (AXE1) n=1 Tax=Tautonia plasticadhaerens TaxID=2527974 RepID=A0A518H5Q3_9BACT|nr:prolyl oligopeptidase family serine peptidase [Tautonia plasticadhaerens]QDV36148.1 Acetyl xylan esterase (AXE1) [Tautonia plasticadhaerens]
MSSRECTFTRRDFARGGAAMAMAWSLARAPGASRAFAGPIQDDGDRPILNRFPRMLQDFYVDRVRALDAARVRALRELETKEDAERHVASVRERIAECFGPMPGRTPLNPRVTGSIDRDGYRVENVIFESRPGFLVTGNIYVPTGRAGKLPGVIGTCGHSTEGKAAEPYQSFAQGLARLGYVCLIIDPIGQGERLQYPGADLGSSVGAGVHEHLLAGNQQLLVGENLGAWRAWDGIRALDYLLTRDEVDPDWIGVTGNSGGGTMTTWLCGLEGRWAMGAPSCFVTSFRRNLENELPADIEQCPPRALELGLDHEDFLAAMAPKPVIILAKERDYFDVRGSILAHRRLKRLYTLLGAPENIGLFVGPTEHGYSQENREAMYGWFNRATGSADGSTEPGLTIEPVEALRCTPEGQVAAMGSKSVVAFTREKSERLAGDRGGLDAEATRAAVASLVPGPGARPLPPYRILRPISGRGYPKPSIGVYAVPTEPGIEAIAYRLYDRAHQSRPPADATRAILYISDKSADAELRDEPLIRELIAAEPESALYACDVRGIGESRPNTCGIDSYFTPYGNDYFYASHGLMLGRPVPAQRALDVLGLLDWLRSIGHAEVHLASRGWGTIPTTLAAVLAEGDAIKAVTLKHAPASFSDIAEAEEYDWPLSSLLPGVLMAFDLPDCYRVLEARGLNLIEPRGATA